jgi:hypothetical protein
MFWTRALNLDVLQIRLYMTKLTYTSHIWGRGLTTNDQLSQKNVSDHKLCAINYNDNDKIIMN